MKRILISLGLGLALTAGAVAAQQLAVAPKPGAANYHNGQGPDTAKILPPAPTPGTIRYQADRATFLATRSLKDSERWKLAYADATQSTPAILKDMSCAVGVEMTPENAPKLAKVLNTMSPDMRKAVDGPKLLYKRQRPYLIDEGDICVTKTDELAASADYPSGHTTFGWSIGLILAELVPDRATEILARGRSYGESRLICGVHNMSAVESGRTNGSILVAGLHGSAAFRTDLEAARKELAGLRKSGKAPDAAGCAAEAELIAKSPYN